MKHMLAKNYHFKASYFNLHTDKKPARSHWQGRPPKKSTPVYAENFRIGIQLHLNATQSCCWCIHVFFDPLRVPWVSFKDPNWPRWNTQETGSPTWTEGAIKYLSTVLETRQSDGSQREESQPGSDPTAISCHKQQTFSQTTGEMRHVQYFSAVASIFIGAFHG